MRTRRHLQKRLRTIEEDGPRDRHRVVVSLLPLLDFSRKDVSNPLANQDGFTMVSFNAISIRKEADLFIGGQHVQALTDHLANYVGEKVVPPVSGQTKVW